MDQKKKRLGVIVQNPNNPTELRIVGAHSSQVEFLVTGERQVAAPRRWHWSADPGPTLVEVDPAVASSRQARSGVEVLYFNVRKISADKITPAILDRYDTGATVETRVEITAIDGKRSDIRQTGSRFGDLELTEIQYLLVFDPSAPPVGMTHRFRCAGPWPEPRTVRIVPAVRSSRVDLGTLEHQWPGSEIYYLTEPNRSNDVTVLYATSGHFARLSELAGNPIREEISADRVGSSLGEALRKVLTTE